MVVSANHFKDVTNGYEKRTDGLWVHTGKFVVRGGPVDLPSGSIGTAELEAGAAQALIGSYAQATTWSSTTLGWVATPVSIAAACTGAMVRLECSSTILHSVANANAYTSFFMDGAQIAQYSFVTLPVANGAVAINLIYYTTPSVAVHTFTLYIYNGVAGTLSIRGDVLSTLYVTEQRR